MKRILQVLIALSVLASLLATVQPARADGGTHTVQAGETLYRIALNNGITVDALRRANGIAGTTIYTGQVLVIPGASSAPVVNNPQPASQPASTGGVHTVLRGENLFRIALKYGMTVPALQSANGLRGVTIYAGQQLTIPGAGTPVTQPLAPVVETPPVPPPSPVVETPPVVAQPIPPPAPTGGAKRFVVDLSEQTVYAFEGDVLLRSSLVSSGRWPTPTVTGTFYIYLKYTSQRMRGPGYNLPGVPYVMYFYQGYALHGTYWHSNFGTPMSHGCVNMQTPEAEWAFNWAPIGTQVVVQN